MSTCKTEVHNIIFIFIIFSFIIFSDHIVLVFKLYQTILNHNITLSSIVGNLLPQVDESPPPLPDRLRKRTLVCTTHISKQSKG